VLRGASVPIAGFGSSDCRCKTHLFFFRRRPSFKEFRQKAQGSVRSNVKSQKANGKCEIRWNFAI
jgi:Uri superfamily endonuclease